MEKSVLTAFTVEENTYIVLDNESVGSMGLPIILVSKLVSNRLTKILDQTEWQKVKENLKTIISGAPMSYINVNASLEADDVFFTQLTLPIASFNALKNNYVPVGETTGGINSEPVTSAVPEITPAPTPVVEPVTPVMPEVTPAPTPVIEPVTPVMPEVTPAPIPVVEPVTPVMPEITSAPTPVVEPVVIPEVVISPIEIPDNSASNEAAEINFDELKKSFMESCENMFDALVIKFKNKE